MKPLRELRINALLSQMALAHLAGVAPRTVLETELGRQVPSLMVMRLISDALDVEPKDVTEFAAAMASKSKTE